MKTCAPNLMKSAVKISLATILVAVTITTVASASDVPRPGVYMVSSYVVSAVATNGGTCGAPQGTFLSSYFSYPGSGKPGAVERHSINGAIGSFIQISEFPVTPAAGESTWSGKYRSARFPGGEWQISMFSTNFTFVDENSFLATTTYTYSVGDNSVCTTVFQNTYIRTDNSSN